ncbi:MAG: hypothetical protein JO266_18900 [Acidobacteria bacterium]|nr:hypothetical protein [Acidobacteriota bacterium]MBV8894006.1 hypothetical protein [Acidobacteriota bacterium]MBV9479837.1 hypothetical protein [Acidobacteriota bacterium]
MKKLLLLTAALALVFSYVALAGAAGSSETVKGWVSDTKCGAKGMNAKHASCAKKCMGAGEKLALVTDKGQKVLTVSNPDALEGHEGHHVEVKGEVSADSIMVDKDSVKMLAAKGEKGSAMSDMH